MTTEQTRRPGTFLADALPALLLVYWVLLGGTSIGEVLPSLRALNAVIVTALVLTWARLARRRADALDLAVTAAVVLFVADSLTSQFMRQSFDAAWLAIGYGAAFSVARHSLMRRPARQFLLIAMAAMSLVLSVFIAARWLPDVAYWLNATGWLAPPLDIHFNASPWGHRHDVALLLVALLPSWLLVGRTRWLLAVMSCLLVLDAVIVVLDGSRNLWLAIAASSALVGGGWAWRRVRRRFRPIPIVLAVGVMLAILFVSTGVAERLLNLRTLEARGELWGASAAAWLERPLTGHGPGSFPWVLQLTDYFDTNGWAPRHPDSMLLQLLPELGLLGLVASALIGIALVRRVKGRIAAWVLTCMVFSCFAANPTDFGFLIATGLAWAAIATRQSPADYDAGREEVFGPLRPIPMPIFGVALVPPLIAVALATVAANDYVSASVAVSQNDLHAAEARLERSVALDPRLALYPRDLGAVQWAIRGSEHGTAMLQGATAINPADDYAWRLLALAQAESHRLTDAQSAIDRALELQRSDLNNLLLAVQLHGATRPIEATELASEALEAYPYLTLAPGWSSFLDTVGLDVQEVVDEALARWEKGEPAPNAIRSQGVVLAVATQRTDLLARARQQAGLPNRLFDALVDLTSCDTDAARASLDAASETARRLALYWELRGAIEPSDVADRLAQIMTGGSGAKPSAQTAAVSENTSPGFGLDEWGYRRPHLPVEQLGIGPLLPSSAAGFDSWLRNPAASGLCATQPDLRASH